MQLRGIEASHGESCLGVCVWFRRDHIQKHLDIAGSTPRESTLGYYIRGLQMELTEPEHQSFGFA